MKKVIGIISDTHIPSRSPRIPESIIKDFKMRNIDYVFHLGDFTNLETYYHLIKTFGKEKVIGIAGNMDDPAINKLLPETRELELLGHKIFLTHGSGGSNRIIKRLNKLFDLSTYDIIVFGHIHHPFNENREGKLYINPGTPTDTQFTDINSYGFLEISKEHVNFEIKYI